MATNFGGADPIALSVDLQQGYAGHASFPLTLFGQEREVCQIAGGLRPRAVVLHPQHKLGRIFCSVELRSPCSKMRSRLKEWRPHGQKFGYYSQPYLNQQ